MKRNSIVFSALLACSLSSFAQTQTETFFSVTSADNQAQGMAMVLASQMAEQKAAVRILLCGPAGQLALKTYEPAALKPRNVTPKQMMTGLIKGGYLESEKLVNLSKHNYRLEPNPSFTPDQKFIVFRSNMFGPDYAFAVEVAKATGE